MGLPKQKRPRKIVYFLHPHFFRSTASVHLSGKRAAVMGFAKGRDLGVTHHDHPSRIENDGAAFTHSVRGIFRPNAKQVCANHPLINTVAYQFRLAACALIDCFSSHHHHHHQKHIHPSHRRAKHPFPRCVLQ